MNTELQYGITSPPDSYNQPSSRNRVPRMDREPDFDNHLMDRSFIDANIPELVDKLTQEEKRILLAADGWWQ